MPSSSGGDGRNLGLKPSTIKVKNNRSDSEWKQVDFTKNRKDNLRENFTDENFTFYFAYLVDIFETINNLNLKLQGRNTNIITAKDSINSFLEKIQLWKHRVNKETPNFSSFRRLNELISDEEKSICLAGLKSIVIEHLDCLTDEFMRYFPDFSNESWKYTLTSCPFSANVDTLPDTFQEQAIELKNDSRAKIEFNSGSSLEEFWFGFGESSMRWVPGSTDYDIRFNNMGAILLFIFVIVTYPIDAH
ncbi:hypothetical protein QTP88_025575 [Uroleucon formosanum]